MIVTEKMAQDAWRVLLSWTPGGLPENPPIPTDEEGVRAAYRTAAKHAHPDVGGDGIGFAAVDRSKHVLLEWIKKPQTARPIHKPEVCPKCDGRGHIVQQRAWRAMRMQCPRCRGAGDLDTEHEQGDL